jgi:murein DD-endopeptidase
LYKRVFNCRGATSGIRAAFFINDENVAVHIAGILDEGVCLNSSIPTARVRSLADIKKWFEKDDCRMEIRGLDHTALGKLSKEGKTKYNLDKELDKYFLK